MMNVNNPIKSILLFSLIAIAAKTRDANCFTRPLPKVRSTIIHPNPIHNHHHQYQLDTKCQTVLKMTNEINVDMEDDDDEEEEVEVGTMKVSELKSELTLRGVDFSDCFDKESLAKKLRDARASGKSDPSIIDQFNKQRVRIFNNIFENAFNAFTEVYCVGIIFFILFFLFMVLVLYAVIESVYSWHLSLCNHLLNINSIRNT